MNPDTFLRRILLLDALTCAAMGLDFILTGAPLASLLALPSALLLESALILLAFAAFVGWTALRPDLDGLPVRAVIAFNALWVLASFALFAVPAITPSPIGAFVIIAQALAGGGIAALQAWGLARIRAATCN